MISDLCGSLGIITSSTINSPGTITASIGSILFLELGIRMRQPIRGGSCIFDTGGIHLPTGVSPPSPPKSVEVILDLLNLPEGG